MKNCVLTALLVLSFALVPAFAGFFGPSVDFATTNDVRFVLNWGHIPTDQKYSVVHSYRTAPHFNGDHLTAFAIQLETFPESLLQTKQSPRWIRGPATNSAFADALKGAHVEAFSDKLTWFPDESELNSEQFYLHFAKVSLVDGEVNAADIIAFDRHRKVLYYISFKH